ncbi:ATP-binding protein [Nocardia sp. NPDC051570]|uniref:ATP-binding protein n=1 Tax=Nocardia sp. NPDC051570 TaxID=3364324 RepID=UPI003791AA76
MATIPNRAVTREFLATVTSPVEFGGALRRTREAAGLSIRRLERKATDSSNGGPPRFVDLTKNLIEDMEKGKRLEANRVAPGSDNRLEIYLWCCDVPKDDLPAWLETRRRILSAPAQLPPEREPAQDVSAQLRPAVKTALRRDVHTFIGRDSELRRLLAAADPEHGTSIYTIDGMPGIGKTALATRAAHMLADQFPDGRYFIELHAHTPGRAAADPADVLAGMLIGLGVDMRYIPDTLEGRRDLWRDRLTGKRVLLVLDDARDVAQIEPLLPAEPECLTLVTSRRRLITLDNAMPLALDILDPEPASQLFTTLTQHAAADQADRAAVARTVRLCGYLPLAITLLAGRLVHHPAWTITELADRFSAATDRLGELDAGARVVRAAFDLSYRDLPPQQKLLFRRLGLHPGADIDAHAAAALAGIDVATARWKLESLYTDHLLDEPASGRYRLHDLLREYGRALADTEPGDDRTRAQHRLLDYYQDTATAADRWLARWTHATVDSDGSSTQQTRVREFANEIEALEWMRLERENMLACLDDIADRDPARMVALTGRLAGLLDSDGPWPLARRLHRRAVAAGQRLGDRLGEANSLNNLGAVHSRAGEYKTAADRFEMALGLFRRLGNHLGEANALNNLGNVHEETGDYHEAADLHRQALNLYHQLGNRLGEANALNNLGNVHEETGDYHEAADFHRRALNLYHQLGNRLGKANALNNLGIVRTRTGLHTEAVDLHRQALALYHRLGNRLGEANALNNLGIVRTRTGLHTEAVDLHRRALDLYHRLGNRHGEASALNNLGIVRTRTGLHTEAAGLHQQALALYHQLGNRLGEANALNNLGIVRTRTGLHAEALGLHRQALDLLLQLHNKRGAAEVQVDIGKLLLDTGAPDAALRMFNDALAATREIGSQLGQARALEGIGRCRICLGDMGDAVELREAIEIYRRIGAPDAASAAGYLASSESGPSD